MLEDFTIPTLTEQLGSTFHVIHQGNILMDLTLKEINIHVNTERHQNFSLIFHGPPQPFLPQGIQTLQHPSLGSSEIFLVPIVKDSLGYLYEAVFNRIATQ